ncbi:MAG: hypothetical protein OEY11_11125 [Gammaproteobacteria bacterium]|nr:hypothetical protein [Gammaproteobacteria bacterium]
MNIDKYLSVHWNNLLMIGLAVPALSYAAVFFFTSIIPDKAGFFGMVSVGIVYCLIVEQHSSMMLKQRIKNTDDYTPAKKSFLEGLTVIIYNFIWWLPVALPFAGIVDYHAGSSIFFFITVVRAMLNLYRVNLLDLKQAFHFPLRGPN